MRRGVAGSRYLSPARPQERKVPGKSAAILKAVEEPAVAAPDGALTSAPGQAEPPPAKGLDADILKTAIDPLEVGTYRVQVSGTEDFGNILFDKGYGFQETDEFKRDMVREFPKGGQFWVRRAFIDLLEFQHPYSRPKRYRFPARR